MWSVRVYFGRVSYVCHHFVRNISTETSKKMRFVQFEVNGAQKVGVELSDGGDIVDLNEADKEIPHDLRSFIAGGQAQLLRAKRLLFPDPHNLRLWCKVNGVTKQDSTTSNLVHKTEELLVFLSRFLTLRPGDIILTGTPPGVGVFRKPPEFLKRGDVVECGIEDIGKTINNVV